jgi:O-antigen/teichoic acid export membrane protein
MIVKQLEELKEEKRGIPNPHSAANGERVDNTQNSPENPPKTEDSRLTQTQNRLLRDGVWVVGGRVLGIATAIGINIVLAWILPPADLGVFFLLASILSFSSFVAMFGLNAGLVRFVSESIGAGNADQARAILNLGARLGAVSIACGGFLSFTFLLWGGEPFFGIQNTAGLAPLLAISVVAFAILQLCARLLRSFHNSHLSILLTGQFGGPICNLMFISLALGLWLLVSPTLEQVMVLSALSMCAVVPVAVYFLFRISQERLGKLEPKPVDQGTSLPLSMLVLACLPLMLTQCLSFLTGHLDIWIAGACVQHEELAIYGAARRLVLLVGMPMQLVNLTVIASIAELRAQGRLNDLQRILRSAATLAAVPAIMVWIPLLLFPAEISTLVFGPYYADGAVVLRILSVGQIVFVCVGAAELTLMMSGQHKMALAINACTSVGLCIGGTLLTQSFGISGLAVACAAVIALQCIFFCAFARKTVGVWTVIDVTVLWRWRKILTDLTERRQKLLSAEK